MIQVSLLMEATFFAIFFFISPLIGDYQMQSDWMAQMKTKKGLQGLLGVATPALAYTACFLVLTYDWRPLAVIGVTHWVIDRYRLSRYVSYGKNFMAPPVSMMDGKMTQWCHPWSECNGTGYHKDTPPRLAFWLMVITDNTMHFTINAVALWYFLT